jgi:hypothetical protein
MDFMHKNQRSFSAILYAAINDMFARRRWNEVESSQRLATADGDDRRQKTANGRVA